MDTIVLSHIHKNIKGKEILKDVNLEIKGSIGLLGPNGAGKTTLMRILTTLIDPSSGTIRAGQLLWENKTEVREHIGYLPQHFSMYKNMTIMECLNHLALLKGIDKGIRQDVIHSTLEEVNLLNVQSNKIRQLSGGMLRRVGIAQALLGNPKLLVVDEPTVGLDIEERVRFRSLLRKLGKNRNIVISTHIVEDIETTCDQICILKNGKVIKFGTKTEILSLVRGKVAEKSFLLDQVDLDSLRVISTKESGDKYIVRYFTTKGEDEYIVEPSLEDAYLYFIQEEKEI
ncbi:ABC-2 type transport system ATP-binding protein [Metabacillus crassostreae]|uniref:ATP-binding cassette domain-containing protein n=1 Tax=Metabacillus crassostreae TaxID=929098 RepID=UPI00195A817F|nr:ATP-binding cassette domain-containing protein [Metabacillus crassostreae]MBM7602714.1 ABC-2 type transport system ATP-binding protein [Metabacillus crassostreae]